MPSFLKITLASILLGLSLLSPKIAKADSLEIAPEAFYYFYDEPLAYKLNKIDTTGMSEEKKQRMKDNPNMSVIKQGWKYGLHGKYTFQPKSKYDLFGEGILSKGEVDHSAGLEKAQNNKNFSFELRTAIGKKVSKNSRGYCGLGFRYLEDDSHGKQSNIGTWGYTRRQNYYSFIAGLSKKFSQNLEGELEYNQIFGNATATNKEGDTIHEKNDSFIQPFGAGARASLKYSQDIGKAKISISPFLRGFLIGPSATDKHGMFEPINFTIESGARVGVGF
ncbi:hypothetical protein J4474_01315 [Candidatus Pacearchaeota archaeon]|nr:hypothetical protein [Candidatus Pacearchaeota archaeon]